VAPPIEKDEPPVGNSPLRAIFVRPASDALLKAALRLVTLFHEPADALAKAANLSWSVFFKDFKEMTAMSPIQYQKRLRLLEARRLMTEEGETAEGSAYKVGYNSASQFSREYSRLFGNPPMRDSVQSGRRSAAGARWADF